MFGARFPIIQAPMAGGTGTREMPAGELVAVPVKEAGLS